MPAILIPIFYLNWFPLDGEWSNIGNVQRIITKISILFILYFLIAQATKNYRTHRHLYVANKHRETSLKTFRTFVESADTDPGVKMQILFEAARTVFTPSHTGYIANEEENPNSSNRGNSENGKGWKALNSGPWIPILSVVFGVVSVVVSDWFGMGFSTWSLMREVGFLTRDFGVVEEGSLGATLLLIKVAAVAGRGGAG